MEHDLPTRLARRYVDESPVKLTLLTILACPECRADLALTDPVSPAPGSVETGTLTCLACAATYPITAGIPRFTNMVEADTSFGYQWNLFRREQLDSENGAGLSADRLREETGWTPESLLGLRVLEVGCGAGRFLEVMAAHDCEVVGVDVSTAVDAAAATVKGRPNAHIVQGDAYRLPFKPGMFDACYCIGVAQHTPNPIKTVAALPPMVRAGGRVAVTVYERKPWTRLNGKYLLRPITKRMDRRVLLTAIRGLMPVLFPLTEVLFRIPVLGRACDFVIPVANYVHTRGLTWRQRYEIAILDTFDRLAPAFDHPLTEDEVRRALESGGIEQLRRLPNPGVNVIGTARQA